MRVGPLPSQAPKPFQESFRDSYRGFDLVRAGARAENSQWLYNRSVLTLEGCRRFASETGAVAPASKRGFG